MTVTDKCRTLRIITSQLTLNEKLMVKITFTKQLSKSCEWIKLTDGNLKEVTQHIPTGF